MKKGTGYLKYPMNSRTPDALVRSEPNKVDNQHNSSLKTNDIIRSPEPLKPENIFKPRTVQLTDKRCDSIATYKKFHNGQQKDSTVFY